MRESAVEAALKARIAALGGECRKVKWVGRNGAPDQLVLLPDGIAWVELKAPGKKLRPNQVREHQRLQSLGQIVFVIDSFALIDKFFPPNLQMRGG